MSQIAVIIAQVRQLVRDKLAPCTRLTVPPKTTTPRCVTSRKDSDVDVEDFQQDGQQLRDVMLKKTDRLLMELLDLQRAKMRDEADDADREKKDDWKLTAAVLDRIFCIVFSVLLVGGTVVFFIVFAVAYRADN